MSGASDRHAAGTNIGTTGTSTGTSTTDSNQLADNACTRCGACCAGYRVDFANEELQSRGGCVPDGLAVALTSQLSRMRGTDHARPRCAALTGTVGQRAGCGIYEWRPSPCREFGLRAPFGQGDEACARARARHGLPPLPM